MLFRSKTALPTIREVRLLPSANGCPLSFRSVDSLKYKEAVLVFYEQNNISAFKKIFIDQYDFAVNTYF